MSKSSAQVKNGGSKGGNKQPKKKKPPRACKQQLKHNSQITTGSTDMLLLSRPQASSDSFDQWLQAEYMPSGFKAAKKNKQVVAGVGAHKRWYQRLRFDLRELLHCFSIAIVIIWLASLVIFALYLFSPCSPLAVLHHKSKTDDVSLITTPTTHVTSSYNNSSTFTTKKQPTADSELSKKESKNSPSAGQDLRHQLSHYKLGNVFARVKDIFFSGGGVDNEYDVNGENEDKSFGRVLVSHYHSKKEYTLEDNMASCVLLSVFAIADIGLSTVFMAHLLLYLLHIVELVGLIFPWFALEIAFSTFFVLVTFAFCVALAIMSSIPCTGVIIVLGNLQFFCAMIFWFTRYRQWHTGELPQKLADDFDGDIIRHSQWKNSAIGVRAPKGSDKNSTPKGGGGKQAGKPKQKVVYRKMFSKIDPSTSGGPSNTGGSTLRSSSQR